MKKKYRIEYSTFLGGNEWDQMREIIPFPDGSVLVGGSCLSTDMPTTPGAFQPHYTGDTPEDGHRGVHGGTCYLARLSPDGSDLVAATHFGGSKQMIGSSIRRSCPACEADRERLAMKYFIAGLMSGAVKA